MIANPHADRIERIVARALRPATRPSPMVALVRRLARQVDQSPPSASVAHATRLEHVVRLLLPVLDARQRQAAQQTVWLDRTTSAG